MKISLAYWAGFFDGEGCVTITRSAIKGLKRPRRSMKVYVVQANRWVVDALRFQFGGSVSPLWKAKPHYRQSWCWCINANQAQQFLELIIPYLVLKRNEAELAIRFQKNRLPRGCNDAQRVEAQVAAEEAQRISLHQMKDKS